MAIRLVVGLGNPGKEYVGTRHNVGFETVDILGGPDAQWRSRKSEPGLYFKLSGRQDVYLAKPQTFMNASGEFVQAFSHFHKIHPAEILVVSDDMDLPLGSIRIRKSGSSGGQNGLKSILERLGTRDVPRLRLGIGPRPAHIDGADFVLGRFRPEEREAADSMARRAAEAVSSALSGGIDAAMNEYNKPVTG